MEEKHGHFSEGQEKEHKEGSEGHFSEGQEKEHREGDHGHFSEGQEKGEEHSPDKEHEGTFAEGQKED
jgi:hypothetical protein